MSSSGPTDRAALLLTPRDPIYRFSRYLKSRFPFRTAKVTLHAGFSCPNLDGTLGTGGCTYCDNRTFSPQLAPGIGDIAKQLADGKEVMREKYRASRFIAYFQSFTNTHAPVSRLREVFDSVCSDSEVVALAVGTRPDCVPEPVLDLLDGYAEDREVWVEYGMQSAHDATAEATNRLHTVAQFEDALARTARRPRLRVCVHVILGLPGEDRSMMMQTAEVLGRLRYHSLKIHHLYVSAGTPMARQLEAGEIRTLSLDEYVSIVADFLERVSPEVSIQRLMGEIYHPSVIAPRWGVAKGEIERLIISELGRRGTTQGYLTGDERSDQTNRPDHGNHGPGRLLPGRVSAGQGVPGGGHGAPQLDGDLRPDQPHP